MTSSRCHLPDQLVSLSRRTVNRQFFLRPDRHINGVVGWELAKASTDHGFEVHGLMTMSNHPHIFGTDLTGERSDFMRDFCSGVARARNVKLRRRGRFFDNQQFGDCVIAPDSVEEKLLYVWLNPVVAGLVRRASMWPGAKILPRDWGKPMKIKLPKGKFYRRKSEGDSVIEFTPMPPPGYEHMTLEEVIAHFEELLGEAEDRIAKQRRRKFRGVRWVLRQDPFDAPGSRASFRQLNPRFAGKNPDWMKRAIAAHRAFQEEYQRSRDRWRNGDRDAQFPAGTIQLRKLAPITCKPLAPDEPTVLRRAA